MATCVPGAEEIVRGEIAETFNPAGLFPREEPYINGRGRAFFTASYSRDETYGNEALKELKCADNLYVLIKRLGIGPNKADLANLRNALKKIDYDEFFTRDGIKITVSASRAGKHSYSRFEAADAALGALFSAGRFAEGTPEDHGAAFRLDINDGECLFLLQLTPPEHRFRGNFQSVAGGIRPSFARCLVRLGGPKGGDVFYDPFCGAGTIANERADFKHKKIFASDIDESALERARANVREGVIILNRNAVSTGMGRGSVDAVVTNMPWGKQVRVEDLGAFYRGFLTELGRILKYGGRALLLTDQDGLLKQACAHSGFEITGEAAFSLHGLRPLAYIVNQLKN